MDTDDNNGRGAPHHHPSSFIAALHWKTVCHRDSRGRVTLTLALALALAVALTLI
jgi:hypothetical protein